MESGGASSLLAPDNWETRSVIVKNRMLILFGPRYCGVRKGNQAVRVISTARLNMLPCLQLPPINVVVSHDPNWDT